VSVRTWAVATAMTLAVAVAMVACSSTGRQDVRVRWLTLPSASASPSPGPAPASPSPTPSLTPSPTPRPTYPATGPGSYDFADGQSAIFGTSGGLRTYRVAVEKGAGVPVAEFAQRVDDTLSDPRSWIAGGDVRLQRVSGDSPAYGFTIYLVTPGTAQDLCLAGGYDIFWRGEPYTSCQVGGQVIINLARYLTAVPDYGAPLLAYQQYAINHEVGHELGHGHELCPGKGRPAPVMQQQTFSLQGCVAYSWPYLDGKRYAGPPGRIVPTG
jgi:hypothetical protein